MSNLLQLFRVGGELRIDGVNQRMKVLLAENDREEKEMMEQTLRDHGWRHVGQERWEIAPSSAVTINMEFGEAYNFVTKHECD